MIASLYSYFLKDEVSRPMIREAVKWVLVMVCTYSGIAGAVSESVLVEHAEKIDAYFDVGNGGTFTSFDGTEVGYWSVPGVGRPIIFVVGLGETFDHYRELFWDLRGLDRPMYALELRGQGYGERLSSESRQVFHVESFDDYTKDLETFVRQHIESDSTFDIVAHSTGGYPAIQYAAKNPRAVGQLVLLSPLIRLELGVTPVWVAKGIARILCWIGRCDHYVTTRKDYVKGADTFAANFSTRSEIRFRRIYDIYDQNKSLRGGGPSNRWLLEALNKAPALTARAKSINVPILLLTAGEDRYVKVNEQRKFCESAPQCRQIIFEDSRHVLMHESDDIRTPAFEEIMAALSDER